MQGHRASELPLDSALSMEYDGEEPVLFRNVWPTTASGKIELKSSLLDERYGAPLPTFRPVDSSSYPLTLISPASDKRITSTFGGFQRMTPRRHWKCTRKMPPAASSATAIG